MTTGDRSNASISGSMMGLDPSVSTAANYRRFATMQAAFGRSPAYQALAEGVANDTFVLSFLDRLPPPKRQPNLLFGAACYLLGRPADIAALRDLVTASGPELAGIMMTRRTQTNEAARCATLLPALSLAAGPIALLEVGASAGLNLLVDHYSYDYTWTSPGGEQQKKHFIAGRSAQAPTLPCQLLGPKRPPLPKRVPQVIWRAGLDINPLDVNNDDEMHWLGCLLWPGEEGRAERLAGAIAIARRSTPPLHRGDLLDDLGPLAAKAPREASLYIFNSAVLAYVDEHKRRLFAAATAELGATWLSSEGPGVVASAGPVDDEPGMVLVRNGTEVLARACPHGSWLRWL